jgi:hypothetical protein
MVFGGPAGMVIGGALMNGGLSYIQQKATTGKVNWGQVGIQAAIGGALGGLGAIGTAGRAGAEAEQIALASNTTRLAARADELHSVLDPIAQTSRTSAVLGTTSSEGSAVDVLAGGVRDLSPAQRALANPGDRLARLAGAHAEPTALKAASEASLTPRAIATTWDICPSCKSLLEESGATLTGPRTAVWPQ